METSAPAFRKYIFVCENERAEGRCCAPEGSRLRELLKEKVNGRGLSEKVRVSRSGCLDVCAQGPNVLLMPDNLWFKRVAESDVDEIIEVSLRGVTQ